MHSLIASLALLASAAWAHSQPLDAYTSHATVTVAANPAVPISTEGGTLTTTRAFPTTTSTLEKRISGLGTGSFAGHCDYSICEGGSNVCFYWAGMTSWDVSSGPVPGEVATTLGSC